MNEDNKFSAEQVFEYYSKAYGMFNTTKTDLPTVQKFLERFGHLYPNDLDKTCDLLRDYVLARNGLF